MKICAITINGNTLPVEEFMELIVSGNSKTLEELTGKPISETNILRKLLVRFDIEGRLDSIMELQAKRKAKKEGVDLGDNPTKEQVNYWTYPRQQFHDYLGQLEIHRNTYSGMRLTGISANSGKALGYQFEATPIKSIKDADGVIYSGKSLARLLNSYRLDTVEDLLYKHSNFEVYEREVPKLKKSVHINVDGVSFDKFSRNELGPNGEVRTQVHSGDPISVFETIDSIINLAIDNVKEQKLFTIGMTNSNANAYFAMIALGVPLETLTRIFTDPSISTLSQLTRIYPKNIKEIYDKQLPIIDSLFKAASQEALEAFKPFFSADDQYAFQTATITQDSSDLLKFLLEKGNINSEVLDRIYFGEASEEEIAISTILVLEALKKAMRIGEEMFAAAQTYSLLRSMPSKASAIEYKTILPTQYTDFSFVSSVNDVDIEEYIASAIAYVQQHDSVYLELPEEQKANYLKNFERVLRDPRNMELVNMELNQTLEASFRNSMMHNALRRAATPSSNSVFTNTAPLSIPHVYSAWKTLNFLKGLLEKTFAMHNPVLKAYMESLMVKADLFTTYNKYQLVEDMIIEFFRFISSNMKLDIGGNTLDLRTTDSVYTVSDVTYYGSEAWSQEFIERLKLAKSTDATNNRFLENLEFTENKNKTWRVALYADKIRDFKIREGIKQDYRLLYEDPATRNLALEVFKHSIATEGLLYTRSAFSQIFPATFIAAYSDQFVQVLNNFFSNNRKLMLSRLDAVGNAFLRQFLRNHPDKAQYIVGYKPKPGKSIKENNYTKGTYSGIATVDGNKLYYDLLFEGLDPKEARNIIKTYGNEVYQKINVDGSNTYYRQITEKTPHNYYEFDLNKDLRSNFKIDLLGMPSLLVPSSFVKNNVLNDPNTHNSYEVGDTVYTFRRNAPRIETIIAYEITGGSHPNYKLKRTPKADISMFDKEVNVFLKYPVITDNTNSSVIYSTNSRVRTIARALSVDNGFAIVRGESINNPKVLAIPINPTSDQISELSLKISMLSPTHSTYYIQNNLLDELEESYRKELAQGLYKSIGYVDETLELLRQDENDITTAIKLKSLSKNRPYFKVGVGPDAHIDLSLLDEFESKGAVTVPYNSLPEFQALKEGDIIYLGKRGALAQFGYVETINTVENVPTSFNMFLIPTSISLELYKDNYAPNEFQEILEEYLNKSKC